MRNPLNTTAEQFNIEVNYHFQEFLRYLNNKGIEYKKLCRALIPNRDKDKEELLLCFDTNKDLNMCNYGQHILEIIFPLLNDTTVHSVHIGDFICKSQYQERAKKLLFSNLKFLNYTLYIDSSQYFFVYLNNITRAEKKKLLEKLNDERMYIGYCNFTY